SAIVINAYSNTKSPIAIGLSEFEVGVHSFDSINNWFIYGDNISQGYSLRTIRLGAYTVSEYTLEDNGDGHIAGTFEVTVFTLFNDLLTIKEGKFDVNFQKAQ